MLKRIPKSDISIRPFKAYKNWEFDESSSEISLLEANISSSELSGLYPKNSIYGQLRAQFYNGNEFDPISRVDSIRNVYDTSSVGRDRYLGDDAKVIAIPQIYVGEGIKKGSVYWVDGNSVYRTHGWIVGTFDYNDSSYSFSFHMRYGGGGFLIGNLLKEFINCIYSSDLNCN